MQSKYELWLCNDRGQRMYLFEKTAFFSYSRTTQGIGTVQLGIPFRKFKKDVPDIFQPDWRLDIWRKPFEGMAARREGSFLIRKFITYQRTTDNMEILEFFGRSPLDILRRQHYRGKDDLTDYLDDMMKTIVSSRFVSNNTIYSTSPTLYDGTTYNNTGEFSVESDAGDGPEVTRNFYLKNILESVTDLKKSSFMLNADNPTSNKRIFFDVIEDDSLSPGGFGYKFRTYPDLRGLDRSNGIEFSTENGNMIEPTYYEDYIDEITAIHAYNDQQVWASVYVENPDRYLSRWNYIESLNTTSQEMETSARDEAYGTLGEKSVKKLLTATFLSSPGGPGLPRSLYGVDWDLGDKIRARFSGKVFFPEISIVYVSVNDKGEEKITARNVVGE